MRTLLNAGYAGRAQVRVALADWTGVVAYAGRVPTTFAYKMPYYANVDEFGYNRTMWSSTSRSFFTATSAWNWWPQAKYATNTAGVKFASGCEARLIEAEASLRGGNIAGAMTLIDTNRASAGAPVAGRPATITDAWTLLKRERGIELWLEGQSSCFPVSRQEIDTNKNNVGNP